MKNEPIPISITCATTNELINKIKDVNKTDYYRTLANEEYQKRISQYDLNERALYDEQ